MSFFIQDPQDINTTYLLEHILEACGPARAGGASFAWATTSGLRLLLEDPTFVRFLTKGSFDLVLGVDAVTNVATLEKLSALVAMMPSLEASVFLHQRQNALFHPKFCWFVGPRGGTIVAGSGNLTLGGLRGNWEAFTVETLSPTQAKTVQQYWTAWKALNVSAFVLPSHKDALAEADKNKGWMSRCRIGRVTSPQEAAPAEAEELIDFGSEAPVLIAELPRSGNRWNQANFSQATYREFFGAKVGKQHRILLQHVGSNGEIGELESRPSVEVKSHNYRFELAAASHMKYPSGGNRPVAVFLRQQNGVFLYRLLLPSDQQYDSVKTLLAEMWSGAARLVRRVRLNVATLKARWPDAPLWKIQA